MSSLFAVAAFSCVREAEAAGAGADGAGAGGREMDRGQCKGGGSSEVRRGKRKLYVHSKLVFLRIASGDRISVPRLGQ